jgi:hypothetical protein
MGWGKDRPDMLRNDDGNYAAVTLSKQHWPGASRVHRLPQTFGQNELLVHAG